MKVLSFKVQHQKNNEFRILHNELPFFSLSFYGTFLTDHSEQKRWKVVGRLVKLIVGDKFLYRVFCE